MRFNATKFLSELFAPTKAVCPESLPEYWREVFDERAAIKEYCGGLSRQEAESQALAETVRLRQMDQEKKRPQKSEKDLAFGIP